jgi:CheY-like chemotaxis protein
MARILVIDDDESLLQMMSLMLRRAGHQTILVSNGHEGIEIARREQPDAAIVDVMMPQLSGYEVCRILREDPRTQDIPLLILTALSQREHREQAQDSGADDYVTKPVTRDDLVAHVEELLRTGARNMPAPLEPPLEESRVQSNGSGAPAAVPVAPSTLIADAPAAPTTPPVPQSTITRDTAVPLVAVMGLSNGVGATTLAVNLGLGLMQFGRSCILDLHHQSGEVAVHLKMAPPRSTWVGLANPAQAIDKRQIGSTLMLNQTSGVAIIAAPLGPTRDRLPEARMTYLFSALAEGFRRLVADLPLSLDDMTITALKAATHLVLVVGDDPADLASVPNFYRTIQDLNLPGTQHIVLNRTRPVGVSYEAVQRALNHTLIAEIPYESAQVNALELGTPLVMARPESIFSRTLLQLARQL